MLELLHIETYLPIDIIHSMSDQKSGEAQPLVGVSDVKKEGDKPVYIHVGQQPVNDWAYKNCLFVHSSHNLGKLLCVGKKVMTVEQTDKIDASKLPYSAPYVGMNKLQRVFLSLTEGLLAECHVCKEDPSKHSLVSIVVSVKHYIKAPTSKHTRLSAKTLAENLRWYHINTAFNTNQSLFYKHVDKDGTSTVLVLTVMHMAKLSGSEENPVYEPATFGILENNTAIEVLPNVQENIDVCND